MGSSRSFIRSVAKGKDCKRRYVILALKDTQADRYTPFRVNERCVVFDTKEMAKWFAPMLGGGRSYVWNEACDKLMFTTLDMNTYNEIGIVEPYYPYDTPAGVPIRSESLHRDWKHHMHWYEACQALGIGNQKVA